MTAAIRDWVEVRRGRLFAVWAAAGTLVLASVARGPYSYSIRGAPLTWHWVLLAFAGLWVWLALRLILLWRWAWVVLILVPASLHFGLRPYLRAPWLGSLLAVLAGLGVLIVLGALWLERRRHATKAEQVPAD